MKPRLHRTDRLHLGAVERMEVHADEPRLGRASDQHLEQGQERRVILAPKPSDRASAWGIALAQVQQAQVPGAGSRDGAKGVDAEQPREKDDLQQSVHGVR